MSVKKNLMLFIWFLKFGLVTARDDYNVHDSIKSTFCPDFISAEEFDEKEQLLRDTPGPVGIKYAYFVGSKVSGVSGAIIAILALFIPVIILSALLFLAYPILFQTDGISNNPYINTVHLINGVHAAVLGLIAAHIYKIAYFNKVNKKSIIVILPAALIFLFLPAAMGINPENPGSLMPYFILGIIILGIILGVCHAAIEKKFALKPKKNIDPYSKKAIKMRDRQLRDEEEALRKFADEKTATQIYLEKQEEKNKKD